MNSPAVKDTIAKHVKAGKSNGEVLAIVRQQHPHAKVSAPTINLYRNALRKKHKGILSDRQARRGV